MMTPSCSSSSKIVIPLFVLVLVHVVTICSVHAEVAASPTRFPCPNIKNEQQQQQQQQNR